MALLTALSFSFCLDAKRNKKILTFNLLHSASDNELSFAII